MWWKHGFSFAIWTIRRNRKRSGKTWRKLVEPFSYVVPSSGVSKLHSISFWLGLSSALQRCCFVKLKKLWKHALSDLRPFPWAKQFPHVYIMSTSFLLLYKLHHPSKGLLYQCLDCSNLYYCQIIARFSVVSVQSTWWYERNQRKPPSRILCVVRVSPCIQERCSGQSFEMQLRWASCRTHTWFRHPWRKPIQAVRTGTGHRAEIT